MKTDSSKREYLEILELRLEIYRQVVFENH